jgi:hypothetical protein
LDCDTNSLTFKRKREG